MEPMHLEIAQETEYFLLSCLLGAALGVVYDFLRVLRNTVSHNKVAVFVEDFLYTLFFGVCFFIFATDLTRGIRAFVLVGMFSGCLVERIGLGNWCVRIISKVTRFVWRTLMLPVKCLFAKIFAVINKRIVKKHLNFIKKQKNAKNPLKV